MKEMCAILLGVIVGVAICWITIEEPKTIISKTKLTPDWKLTTNGKTVDTLYIYTAPKN